MKTIECREPNRFVMKETEKPAPGPGEALIRIKRIGICGTDLHAYRGRQPFFTYPRILGHELAAEIVQIGDNEYGLQTGDQVSVFPYLECGQCIACRQGKTNCCVRLSVIGVHQDGGMREYMTVPASHLIPAKGITPEQAAVIEPLSISAHAAETGSTRRRRICPGDRGRPDRTRCNEIRETGRCPCHRHGHQRRTAAFL